MEYLWRAPGRRSTAYNRLVETINEMNRPEIGSSAAELPVILMRSAEIQLLETTGTHRLICIEPGNTLPTPETFDIYLPPVYTELSRPYGDGTVTYVYSNLNTRTASGAQGPNETQYLEPPFLIGETILAMWNDLIADYMVVPDGRFWAVDPPSS